MSKSSTFAVIGAGHGGKAMAADLALKGFNVRLFNRTLDHIETICARGGIELERPREHSSSRTSSSRRPTLAIRSLMRTASWLSSQRQPTGA